MALRGNDGQHVGEGERLPSFVQTKTTVTIWKPTAPSPPDGLKKTSQATELRRRELRR